MEEVIQSILTIGGFGFLNYQIFSRIRDYDLGTESDKKLLIYLFSSMDYLIYLIIDKFLKNISITIIITIFISILITILLPFLLSIISKGINKIRSKNNLPEQKSELIFDTFTNDADRSKYFVFNLSTNELTASGYISHISGINEDKSIILSNFYDNDEEVIINNIDELKNYIIDKKIKAKTYLNFDKNIKIIYF
ncbi:hypothetical protein GKS17_05205 [Streptococcus uberis]|uniref:hypothetical protein n=1 Tax=Streptococcus uberis TaxID=1349 RepID=UPI0012B61858|nr:hypothetical protein [Streptococcus uberis]MTC90716.1 hypothetical protein [Streptococcus uberis]MTC96196.1 hypothetical protein [Streptococcus uberis]